MSINLSVQNFQQVQDQLKKELDKLRSGKHVTVGIHESAGGVESSDLTMASLGAIHEFGAEINHPGGTSYGYATEADASAGKVRFLKSGQGYAELGVTGPHQINIPARPWLAPGVESGTREYIGIIESGVKDGKSPDMILETIGVIAVGKVQQYMTDLKTPPNAPSTIAKKGSSNPLIDSGAMRQSVTYVVQQGNALPDEGLE